MAPALPAPRLRLRDRAQRLADEHALLPHPARLRRWRDARRRALCQRHRGLVWVVEVAVMRSPTPLPHDACGKCLTLV
jgi:hypothetical protein